MKNAKDQQEIYNELSLREYKNQLDRLECDITKHKLVLEQMQIALEFETLGYYDMQRTLSNQQKKEVKSSNKTPTARQLLTVKQVCKMIKKDSRTVRKYARNGVFDFEYTNVRKIGMFIYEDSVKKYMDLLKYTTSNNEVANVLGIYPYQISDLIKTGSLEEVKLPGYKNRIGVTDKSLKKYIKENDLDIEIRY